jgi:chemotaxis protein methyltransferase CheR
MTPEDFAYICRLVRDRSAIVLEPGKEYLVETRLFPVVRSLKLESISQLVQKLRGNDNGMIARVIEAIVTTETSFFRDMAPYEALKKTILPELIAKRRDSRRLNIWSAACSTGQEPYSLVMLLRESFAELSTWNVTILATDISGDVLTRARAGHYNQIEVNRGLPAAMLARYFTQLGNVWELSAEIRNKVEFREMNLTRAWPPMARMDIVLLRNVMIYFDPETRKSILSKVASLLKPDGYLLLGGAETTLNLNNSFRRVEHFKTGFYQLIS